jgi:HAD superfamily hydrolase (TIGR01509 family)
MAKLAIFDMDQTLVDVFSTHNAAMAAALQETYGVTGSYADLPGRGAGIRITVSITELATKKGVPMDVAAVKAKEALTRYEEHFIHGLPPSVGSLPGAVKLLKALQERGVRLALVTGSPERIAKSLLKAAGLDGFFEVAVFGEEAATRDGLVRKALEKAKVQPADVVAVGDSIHDIDAARAVGVRIIAVATGPYTKDQLLGHKPDLLIDSLSDGKALELLA